MTIKELIKKLLDLPVDVESGEVAIEGNTLAIRDPETNLVYLIEP